MCRCHADPCRTSPNSECIQSSDLRTRQAMYTALVPLGDGHQTSASTHTTPCMPCQAPHALMLRVITHRTVIVLLEAGIVLRSSSILLLFSHPAFCSSCCCCLEAVVPQSGKPHLSTRYQSNTLNETATLHCLQRARYFVSHTDLRCSDSRWSTRYLSAQHRKLRK